MNFGMVIRHALNKANLPLTAPNLELAKNECNFIIQDLWYKGKANWRTDSGSITTADGTAEYVTAKYFDGFVLNTLQGPTSNPITYEWREPEEFYRLINPQVSTGSKPYVFTFGEMVGYDTQLAATNKVRVQSSLTTKTTSTVNVVNGDERVSSGSDIFTINDVGLIFKRGTDLKTYKISQFVDSKHIILQEKYRGVSGTGVTYEIGDIGTHVNIMGYVSGEITSEDIELDGATWVTSVNTYTSLVSISKSGRTGGRVTVQNEAGTQTVGVMSGAETEIERRTVVFWPEPGSIETLLYRFYKMHPELWLDSDRILIPVKWHRLVAYKLEVRLHEWAGQDVPQSLLSDISTLQYEFENEMNDVSQQKHIPDSDGRSRHGESYYYDRFPER